MHGRATLGNDELARGACSGWVRRGLCRARQCDSRTPVDRGSPAKSQRLIEEERPASESGELARQCRDWVRRILGGMKCLMLFFAEKIIINNLCYFSGKKWEFDEE